MSQNLANFENAEDTSGLYLLRSKIQEINRSECISEKEMAKVTGITQNYVIKEKHFKNNIITWLKAQES